jgi:tellurite resistance protein
MAKKPTREQIESFAGVIRDKVSVPRQNEVFKAAVDAAHLASMIDGKIDEAEKKAIVEALEVLSKGHVIEWEIDLMVDEAQKSSGSRDAKAKAIGDRLKELGQPEAGLYVAAFVAQSTAGIDDKEARVLKSIGKAAGIGDKRVREILKDVGTDPSLGEG